VLRRRLPAFVGVLIALGAGAVCAQAQAESKMHREEHFSLLLPPGFEVKKSAPVQDFELYFVSKAGTAYVTVYVGNQPDFARLKRDGQNHVTTLRAPDFEMISLWKDTQLLGREIMVTLTHADTWPTRLHVWTAALPPEELQVADRILSSLTVLK
jgi:hypothetical protein